MLCLYLSTNQQQIIYIEKFYENPLLPHLLLSCLSDELKKQLHMVLLL